MPARLVSMDAYSNDMNPTQDLELEEFRALEREILKGVALPAKAPLIDHSSAKVRFH